MKEQTELIEAMKERRIILAHSSRNDMRGCKLSLFDLFQMRVHLV